MTYEMTPKGQETSAKQRFGARMYHSRQKLWGKYQVLIEKIRIRKKIQDAWVWMCVCVGISTVVEGSRRHLLLDAQDLLVGRGAFSFRWLSAEPASVAWAQLLRGRDLLRWILSQCFVSCRLFLFKVSKQPLLLTMECLSYLHSS